MDHDATHEFASAHACGHLDLLDPPAQLTPTKALEIALAGEVYEYTEMYPNFRHLAEQEGNAAAVKEMDGQMIESKNHAKRFAALAKVDFERVLLAA